MLLALFIFPLIFFCSQIPLLRSFTDRPLSGKALSSFPFFFFPLPPPVLSPRFWLCRLNVGFFASPIFLPRLPFQSLPSSYPLFLVFPLFSVFNVRLPSPWAPLNVVLVFYSFQHRKRIFLFKPCSGFFSFSSFGTAKAVTTIYSPSAESPSEAQSLFLVPTVI